MLESDTELPDDEEEILVYVEFEDFTNNSVFTNKQLQLDMIGLDTDHPIMQVNGRFYEGTYEDAIGTYMFFEENMDQSVEDPVFDTSPTLKYLNKTRKLLKMQRIFTKHRTEVFGDSVDPECIPNIDTLKQAGIPPKYQEEALSFWTKVRDNRLEALSAYLEKQRIRDERKSQGLVPESDSDEDSLFAMYRENQQESMDVKKNMPLLNTNDESNTSLPKKDVDEASDPPLPKDNAETNKSTNTHKASIKTLKKRRGKVCNKSIKRETKEESNNSQLSTTANVVDKCETVHSQIKLESECVASIVNAVDDIMLQSDNNENDATNVVDKKMEKLMKREAKAKEIAERLKAVAHKSTGVRKK